MKVLRAIEFYIKFGLVSVWFFLTTLVFYLLSFPFYKRPWLAWAYAKVLNFGTHLIFFIYVRVRGRENIVPGPAILIINHQSNFDSFLQGSVFQKNTVIIGKKELGKVPLWGHLFKATNNIMIDRSDRKNSVSGLDAAVDRLKNDDCYVWIFPEGTRSKGRGMRHFKKGAFYMAVDAQVPIIPIITSPMHNVLDVQNKNAKGGIYDITVYPAIDTTGMTHDDIPQTRARL